MVRGRLGPRLADLGLGRAFQGGEGTGVTALLPWQGCSGVREGGWAYRKHRNQNRHTDSGLQNGGRAWTSSPDIGDPIPLGQLRDSDALPGTPGKGFLPPTYSFLVWTFLVSVGGPSQILRTAPSLTHKLRNSGCPP